MTQLRVWTVILLALFSASVVLAGFPGVTYTVKEVEVDKPTESGATTKVKAVEFSVTGKEAFPVRALDPVLHVGSIEVRQYRYADMENKTLIFTLFEPEKLSDDASIYLQYENDETTKTDLPKFRLDMLKAEK